jgi:hypothetical protein
MGNFLWILRQRTATATRRTAEPACAATKLARSRLGSKLGEFVFLIIIVCASAFDGAALFWRPHFID